jgi:hypothetical protein
MNPEELKSTLNNIFSSSGFVLNGYNIKCNTPLDVKIENKDNNILITFNKNTPVASIKKIITLSVNVEQICLENTGGYIKFKYFPVIRFSYDKVFSDDKQKKNLDPIYLEIDNHYANKNEREVAKMCLRFANEWATICQSSGVDFSNANRKTRFELKKQCYSFVEENVHKELEKEYGSIILTWVFIYIVLPMIIKWIVAKILSRLYS